MYGVRVESGQNSLCAEKSIWSLGPVLNGPFYTSSKADFSLVAPKFSSECGLQGVLCGHRIISGHRCWGGLNHRPQSNVKMYLSKISYLMFMFITGCVNHFGFDMLFGFLLLCVKQWLERGFLSPLLKAIFRTVEDIFIMPRAF